ncbi:MAG: TIR domain-containing protein [Planctomycetota bacterium]|jgi:predicted nucleotide-binding protein
MEKPQSEKARKREIEKLVGLADELESLSASKLNSIREWYSRSLAFLTGNFPEYVINLKELCSNIGGLTKGDPENYFELDELSMKEVDMDFEVSRDIIVEYLRETIRIEDEKIRRQGFEPKSKINKPIKKGKVIDKFPDPRQIVILGFLDENCKGSSRPIDGWWDSSISTRTGIPFDEITPLLYNLQDRGFVNIGHGNTTNPIGRIAITALGRDFLMDYKENVVNDDIQGDTRISSIEELLKEGSEFTFENFSFKSKYRNTSALKREYTSWKIRSRNIIVSLLGKESPVYEEFCSHESITLIGNGEREFQQVHSIIMGALDATIYGLSIQDSNAIPDNIPNANNKSIFIVHGHDEKLKSQVEVFLYESKIEPIVLHRKPDQGRTIIEKFEKYSNVGFAFILLTPDDISYPRFQDDLDDNERHKSVIARPNVIFEFGYFVGKLGRKNVCCIYIDPVSLPSDVSGIIYKEVKSNLSEIEAELIKELRAAGYEI